jgi:hypothetical protein
MTIPQGIDGVVEIEDLARKHACAHVLSPWSASECSGAAQRSIPFRTAEPNFALPCHRSSTPSGSSLDNLSEQSIMHGRTI